MWIIWLIDKRTGKAEIGYSAPTLRELWVEVYRGFNGDMGLLEEVAGEIERVE